MLRLSRDPAPRRTNVVHAVLGAVGVAAWLLYLLACLPTVSWSPDGSKIVFTYQRADPDETGIALYDLTTGETQRLFVGTDPDNVTLADWTQDGKHVIVYQVIESGCWDETLTIHLLGVRPGQPARMLLVGENIHNFVAMPPQLDGDIFLGGTVLARVDPSDGSVVRERDLGSAIVTLAGSSDRIYYVGKQEERPWEKAHRPLRKTGKEEPWRLEIGELEPEELTLRPLFELSESMLEPFVVKEVYTAMWPDPSGALFALVIDGEQHGAILLCASQGLERIVTPEVPWESYRLGNLQWSLDGKTLYAGIVTPSDDDEWLQFSLAEIAVEGGPTRLVPIVRLRGEPGDLEGGDVALTLPTIGLSPDGNAIAVAATLLWDDPDDLTAPERLALFLVDLRDTERSVREIRPDFLRPAVEAD